MNTQQTYKLDVKRDKEGIPAAALHDGVVYFRNTSENPAPSNPAVFIVDGVALFPVFGLDGMQLDPIRLEHETGHVYRVIGKPGVH